VTTIKAVILDFDGTLVDSNMIKMKSFFDATEKISGVSDYLKDLLDAQNGLNRYEIFDRVTAWLGRADEMPSLSKELSDRYSGICQLAINNSKEIRGASPLLAQLQNTGMKVFICSATPDEHLLPIVQHREWHSLVEGVYGVPPSKFERIKQLIGKYGYSRREVMMIGDQQSDYSIALALGCRFIGVGNDQQKWDNEYFPKLIVEDLREVPELLYLD
tara:strand:- start:6581 stop:7231 length:651 start_codon:yes stop_codon:yes gene_type:complete